MTTDIYRRRPLIIGALFVIVSMIFIVRLLFLQVLDDTWKLYAENNVLKKVVDYPARGLVYDRNGKLLVYNQAAYDVLITTREIESFDTLEFCQMVGETEESLENKFKKMRKSGSYSSYKPYPIIKQLTAERYAVLQEKLYKYPGFEVQARTIRQYPFENAAHILGYVGEANKTFIRKNPYYKDGDYRGITGLENSYEKELRGRKGVRYKLKDVHNRMKGSFKEGKYDTTAVIGRNLITTLDAHLQSYGERLMYGKAGGIVAIEPKTGEILAYVTSPSYKPSLFVGKDRGKNYMMLENDPLKPLIDRAGQSKYPPGSTFKMLNALIGLQEGALTTKTKFICNGVGTYPITCSHNHGRLTAMVRGIQESCNPYFYQIFKSILGVYPKSEQGLTAWHDHMVSFGLGKRVAPELRFESRGNIPTSAFYNRVYHNRWNSLTVRSVSIGQGEVETTVLQMANVASAIANKGYYIQPHFVREIVSHDGERREPSFERKESTIDSLHFDPVIEGMQQVIRAGTGRSTVIEGVNMAGKTGTIQHKKGEDAHSSFIAFAPVEKPEISIFVYVERGKSGARMAGQISSLMIEKYLKGELSEYGKQREKRILAVDLLGIRARDKKIEEERKKNRGEQ